MAVMTGASYLAETFDANGIDAVFLVPTMLSRTLYELEQRTAVRRIVTHGEKAAAYMADGYARASGRHGVVFAQTIGAANLAAGLRDPYLANTPVLALSGGPYSWSRHRMQYQEIDDLPLFSKVTKFSAHVPDTSRLADLLPQAMRTAVSGRPGPVHLELPGHAGELIEDGELDAEIRTDLGPAPRFRVWPDPAQLDRALAAIRAARRPVIVSGGGVRTSGAQAELRELAETLGTPVATSLNGKDTIPASHPLAIGIPGLYPRASTNQILLEADLVFYVGSQVGSQLTLNWQIPAAGTTTVHLDIEPTALGRHHVDAVPVLGDAKVTLQAMLEQVRAIPAHADLSAWRARVAELGARWHEEVASATGSEATPIRPERLVTELGTALPDDALVVVDTGHAGMWAGGYLDLVHDGQGFLRAAGSLGWGLPAALGAKLAQPRRPVALFTGDGGFWYHVAELETAARWNIGAVLVVNNNRALNQEINPYTVAYGGTLHGRHHELWHFEDVDFTAVAASMGVAGYRVTRPADLAPTLEKAFAHGGPVVVDVVTDIDVIAPKGHPQPAA